MALRNCLGLARVVVWHFCWSFDTILYCFFGFDSQHWPHGNTNHPDSSRQSYFGSKVPEQECCRIDFNSNCLGNVVRAEIWGSLVLYLWKWYWTWLFLSASCQCCHGNWYHGQRSADTLQQLLGLCLQQSSSPGSWFTSRWFKYE